jgi:hypothetical protein
VLRQNPHSVLVPSVPEDPLETRVYALRVSLHSPCPNADEEYRCQQGQPENERVLVVREVKRVYVKLAEVRSVAAPV